MKQLAGILFYALGIVAYSVYVFVVPDYWPSVILPTILFTVAVRLLSTQLTTLDALLGFVIATVMVFLLQYDPQFMATVIVALCLITSLMTKRKTAVIEALHLSLYPLALVLVAPPIMFCVLALIFIFIGSHACMERELREEKV